MSIPPASGASWRTARCARALTIAAQVKTVTARNIVGEIPGTAPEEGWIVACGHYDGHDIGQGAQDNAAASAILMEAARLLAPYRDQLKLGIRFILFSGEELGLYGSYAYAREHAAQLDNVRLVFNADVVGMAMPLVLRTQASPELAAYLRGLPLDELDAVVNDGPGSFIQNSDHFPFSLAGVQSVWALTSQPATGGWLGPHQRRHAGQGRTAPAAPVGCHDHPRAVAHVHRAGGAPPRAPHARGSAKAGQRRRFREKPARQRQVASSKPAVKLVFEKAIFFAQEDDFLRM